MMACKGYQQVSLVYENYPESMIRAGWVLAVWDSKEKGLTFVGTAGSWFESHWKRHDRSCEGPDFFRCFFFVQIRSWSLRKFRNFVCRDTVMLLWNVLPIWNNSDWLRPPSMLVVSQFYFFQTTKTKRFFLRRQEGVESKITSNFSSNVSSNFSEIQSRRERSHPGTERLGMEIYAAVPLRGWFPRSFKKKGNGIHWRNVSCIPCQHSDLQFSWAKCPDPGCMVACLNRTGCSRERFEKTWKDQRTEGWRGALEACIYFLLKKGRFQEKR